MPEFNLPLSQNDALTSVGINGNEVGWGPAADGDKLYMVGNDVDNLYSYDVSTAYDIFTASFNQSFDIGSEVGSPDGLDINNDGTKVYIINDGDEELYSYTLGTAHDISTASFNQTFDFTPQDDSPKGIAWNDDGSKLYMTGGQNQNIYSYDLSTEFDISTASFNQSLDLTGAAGSPFITDDLTWSDDGSKLYWNENSGVVYEYNVSTNFDISTTSFNQSADVSGNTGDPISIVWSSDGSKFYTLDGGSTEVDSYNASTDFDISSLTYNQSFDVGSESGFPEGIAWKSE